MYGAYVRRRHTGDNNRKTYFGRDSAKTAKIIPQSGFFTLIYLLSTSLRFFAMRFLQPSVLLFFAVRLD